MKLWGESGRDSVCLFPKTEYGRYDMTMTSARDAAQQIKMVQPKKMKQCCNLFPRAKVLIR